MKAPKKSPVTTPAKPAAPVPAKELLESYRSQIIELGQEVDMLKQQVESKITQAVDDAAETTKESIFALARKHFAELESAMVERMHEFTRSAMFWETEIVFGSSISPEKARDLARRGFSYAHTVYDPNTKDVTRRHGSLFRRPKSYPTAEALGKAYKSYLTEDTRQQKEALKKELNRQTAAEQVDDEVKSALRRKSLAKNKADK